MEEFKGFIPEPPPEMPPEGWDKALWNMPIRQERRASWLCERIARPFQRTLGEIEVNDLWQDCLKNGRTPKEFNDMLSVRQETRRILEQEKQEQRQIEQLAREEIERLDELRSIETHLVEREGGPSMMISGGTAPRTQQSRMTYVEASEKFGDGEITWEEFQPWKEAHDAARNERGY